MYAIRNLLDFLADETPEAIDRLCDLRDLKRRGLDSKREALCTVPRPAIPGLLALVFPGLALQLRAHHDNENVIVAGDRVFNRVFLEVRRNESFDF